MTLYANIKNNRYIYLPATLGLRSKRIKYLVEKEISNDHIEFYTFEDQPPKGIEFWTLSYDKKNRSRQHALIKATKLIKFMKVVSTKKKWKVRYDTEDMILIFDKD